MSVWQYFAILDSNSGDDDKNSLSEKEKDELWDWINQVPAGHA